MTQFAVRFSPNRIGLDVLLKQPQGDVGRYLHQRGVMIQSAARAQAGFRTGALRASINVTQSRTMTGQQVRVGSTLPYAYMHHEGTRPHRIGGRDGGILRFTRGARIAYSRDAMHPGTRPNRYLSDNLWLALT